MLTVGPGCSGSMPGSVQVHTVAFEVIETCNLYCDFCVRSASHALRGVLSPERFRARALRIARAFPGLDLAALTGGEPFLHRQIVEMAAIAARVGRSVSITTNGTVWRPAQLAALAALGHVHIIISLDGPEAAVHDPIRGQPGAFDRTIAFAEACRRHGLRFLVNMTVNERNHHAVSDTARLAHRLGALDISIALVKPEGRGRGIEEEQLVLAETGRQYLCARRELEASDFHVSFTDPLAHIFEPGLAAPGVRHGCGASGSVLHVQCDGNVLLCTACKQTLGNLDDPDLELAGRMAADKRLLTIASRSALGGACGTCDLRDACGGCRCRAAPTESGFLGGDPLCPRNTSAAAGDRLWPPGWGAADLVRRWVGAGALPSVLDGLRGLLVDPAVDEALALAALGAEVDVFDESLARRAALKHEATQRGLHVRLAGYSPYELNHRRPGDYDFAYVNGLFERLAEPQTALAGLASHLRPGAPCLVFVAAGPHLRFDRLTVLELLRCAGLSEVRVVMFDRWKLQLVARRVARPS